MEPSLKSQLIQEFQQELAARNQDEQERQKNKCSKWLQQEVISLRNAFEFVFGDAMEYNVTYRQNVDSLIGEEWQPFIEVEALRAAFRTDNHGQLVMFPIFELTAGLECHYPSWRRYNPNAPTVRRVPSRAAVGELLADWEKADWDLRPQPAPKELEFSLRPARFEVVTEGRLNFLWHNGRDFIVYNVVFDTLNEQVLWAIEFFDVQEKIPND